VENEGGRRPQKKRFTVLPGDCRAITSIFIPHVCTTRIVHSYKVPMNTDMPILVYIATPDLFSYFSRYHCLNLCTIGLLLMSIHFRTLSCIVLLFSFPLKDTFGTSYTLDMLIYPIYLFMHIELKYVGYICQFHKFTKFSQMYWLDMNKLPLSLCLSSYLSDTAARRLQ